MNIIGGTQAIENEGQSMKTFLMALMNQPILQPDLQQGHQQDLQQILLQSLQRCLKPDQQTFQFTRGPIQLNPLSANAKALPLQRKNAIKKNATITLMETVSFGLEIQKMISYH